MAGEKEFDHSFSCILAGLPPCPGFYWIELVFDSTLRLFKKAYFSGFSSPT